MPSAHESSGTVRELPRGGYLVRTPAGNVQFGAPPETIKDTIVTEESVPQVFVLPDQLFHWQKGINVGDMEFPIYYNFFLRKRKVMVCCTAEQGAALQRAMQEAVFGPDNLDLSRDVYEVGDDTYVPDIRGELRFFRGSTTLDDMFELRYFNEQGMVSPGEGVEIRRAGDGWFAVVWDGQEQVHVPSTVAYTPQYHLGERLPEPFSPPRFGVTCLGPSHGFDPHDNTSGFIIWLNRAGIMVDPPVNSTEWLTRSNVNPKLIDSIILTHCHADHDAGSFQKILEESRVTIYTTHTIMDSFLRKYSAFSGESPDYLRTLFTFQPLYIGRPFFLHGGEFQVYYSLHSIPTMAFRLQFQDKSFVYSSDHQADPEIHKRLLDEGIIDRRRFDQLRDFAWDSDVIYHEAGIPPLHTPITFLDSLSDEIRRKIVVFHIAKKDFPPPEETLLTLATFGIENTLYFETEVPPYEGAYRVLDVLKRLDFARSISITKIQQFVSIIEWRAYSRGTKIIEEGTIGDEFFIIVNGNATVQAENLARGKRLGAYEYFGETALLTNSVRTADIVAETDVEAIVIRKAQFLNFISGTEFEQVLMRLIKNRSEETWNILVGSPLFEPLTDYQRMWLESVLNARELEGAGTLVEQGKRPDGVYVVRKGEAIVEQDGEQIGVLERGDLAGDLHVIQRDSVSDVTVRHPSSISVFYISREHALEFLERNPGTAMRLAHTSRERAREQRRARVSR